MQTNNIPTITKEDIPALAAQTLDELLDQPGTILYSSHETISPGSIYLIGLNPGGSESDKLLRGNIANMLSETQNAYLDEAWGSSDEGKSPLQRRVQWVLETLGTNPRDVLSTNLIFKQSPDSTGVTTDMARKCWPIHEALLGIVQPSLIVAFGNSGLSPYNYIYSLYGGTPQEYQLAGHGDWNLKRFQTSINGRTTTVIGLPHLSWYQPMGKPNVEAWLKTNLPR
ncbi:uracil-DNA glycosylase family protein [Alcaligenes sp. NLF5-7]|uniref:uracil-DNA glycosylase family protein n=1 Tax=Alcaligenes sp. NLF5-7 TaxID=2918755 RepID=UPI0020C202FD|nr:uracil-DNA glycosylase family protein [Alcaligenes sp. NLF5-7]UTM02915.1 uracil-DNA glycosylase family protein [Alcaligenes sp. NLF5-7]